MLKIEDIRQLIKAVDESKVEEFKYEYQDTKLVIKKVRETQQEMQIPVQKEVSSSIQVSSAPATEKVIVKEEVSSSPAPVKDKENLHIIKSPMVGTFYASPSPDSPSYVKVGEKVNKQTVVCIVEAMKLMNEIEAEVKGEIVEILVENGQLIEYGQELFVVKPE